MKSAATGVGLPSGYWHTLRRVFDTSTTRLAKDLDLDWPFFLGVSAVLTVVGVAVLRGLLSLTVDSGRLWLAIVGVVPALLLAMLCLVAMVWSWWRSRLDPEDKRPYAVAFLVGLITIGVCIEAFAGLTTVLWTHGPIAGSRDGPSLWGAELYFLWHLIDSVPLLAIPPTLQWSEPGGFLDQWSGSLALAFRVVVLLPAIQVLVAGYRYLHARNIQGQAKRDADLRRRGRLVGSSDDALQAVLYAGAILATAAGLFAILAFLVAPGSWGYRRLDTLIPEQVPIGSVEVSLEWILAIPVVAMFLLAAALLHPLTVELSYTTFLRHVRRGRVLAGAIAVLASLLVALNGVATAAQLALLRVGLADTPSGMPENQTAAVSGWLSWQATDTIPALRIPQTLHWQPAAEFTDRWSGSLAVVHKVVFVAIVFVWLPRLLLSFAHHARSGVVERGALGSAGVLLSQLHRVVALLDAAAKVPDDLVYDPKRSYWSASRAIAEAEDMVDVVRRTFGDGDVTESADRAMAAIADWQEALNPFRSSMIQPFRSGPVRHGKHLDRCLGAVDDYRTAVDQALTSTRRSLRQHAPD